MIDKAYVLFTRIALTKTKQGRMYCDPLWAKDLKLHLEYLSNFRMCCPVVYSENIHGLEDISECGIKKIVELRKDYGYLSVLKNILPNLIRVIKACQGADIIHSGGAGWAFPLSFYLILLKPFFRFQWIIVIESSPWMLNKNDHLTPIKIISHFSHKFLLTRCLRKADARIFTQSFYRKYFLKEEKSRTLIAPATWIDQRILATPEIVTKRHFARSGKPLRLIFPARLVEDKGVYVLIHTIEYLRSSGLDVEIDIAIMGKGELKEYCQQFAQMQFGKINVSFIEPAEYGVEFFRTLGDFDLVLVPNLKEEQPRIIFDAFSQGLGVIGSDTSGILDITVDGGNALLFRRGDHIGLANAICNAANNPHIALQLGLNGLEYAKHKTHLQMHKDRLHFLSCVLTV